MKRTFTHSLIFALAFLSAGPALAAASRRDDRPVNIAASNEVLIQEAAWNNALANHDRNALNAILADEFMFKDAAGKLYTKAQYSAAVMRTPRPQYYAMTEVRPSPAGEKATATGRLNVSRTNASGDFRFSDTLVKRAGRWQVVTSQETRVSRP
jgi:hypothetical protein